jgi:DNA-binding GntR family transcriptional regulator
VSRSSTQEFVVSPRDGMTIEKRPLDKQAADLLRQRIVTGAFAPGYRLVESQLSEQMSLSRGTIRSALNDLTHEGLVTQKAYTNWVVSEFSAADAWELFTLRSALEGLAARLAAERIGAEEKDQLWAAFAQLESAAGARDWARLTDADFLLHKTIIAIAQHRRLAQQYRLLEQQVRMVIGSSNALVPTMIEVVAQHLPLVEAIGEGQAARAEKLARAHNLDEGKALVKHAKHARGSNARKRKQSPVTSPEGAGPSGVTPSPVAKRTRVRA